MPLHAETKIGRRISNCFDQPIVCSGYHFKRSGRPERLVMPTMHLAFAERSTNCVHGAACMVRSRGAGIWEMLIEFSTSLKSHDLHAQANAQDRHAHGTSSPVHRHIELLTIRLNLVRLWMGWPSPEFHDGVVSTAQNQPITASYEFIQVVLDWHEGDGQAPCGRNGSFISPREPDSPIRNVGRDTNEREFYGHRS
jgi:hypothetical protein